VVARPEPGHPSATLTPSWRVRLVSAPIL